MAKNKEKTTIWLPLEIKEKINFLAKKENRSLTAQIEYLCKRYIEDYEKVSGDIFNEKKTALNVVLQSNQNNNNVKNIF